MKVVQRIAFKEFKEGWRDGSFKFFTVLFISILLFSLIQSGKEYNRLSEIKNQSKSDVRRQWVDQKEKNPHAAGHFGYIAFKSISPLFIIEKGMSDYLGQSVYLETHKQNDVTMKPAKDSNSLLRFGELTPGFLLQFLLPLLVILFTYSAVSHEKERSTLKLLMSQGVNWRQLLAGKLIGILMKLLIILFPPLLLAGIFISGSFHNEPSISGKFWLMILFYVLYLLIFVFISLGISSLAASSRKSLIILVGFWMITCVFIPKISSSVSEKVYPAPSSVDFRSQFEADADRQFGPKSKDNFAEVFDQIQKELMKKYNVDHPDSLPVNTFGFAIEATEEQAHDAYDKSYGNLHEIFRNQNSVHTLSGVFSPLPCIRFLFMGFSGTDVGEHFHFANSAEMYRRGLMKTLNMDIALGGREAYNVKTRKTSKEYTRGKELWASIPDFTYQQLSVVQILKNYAIDVSFLFFWFFISLVFMIGAFKLLKV